MTKKSFAFIVVFAVLLFFMAAFCAMQKGSPAFADDVSLNNVDRVVLDVRGRDENDVAVDLEQPSLDVFEADFGTTITLRARLDDNDDENPDELYDEVYLYYQWWYAAPGSDDYVPLSDRIPGERNVTLTLRDCSDSGRYYVWVTNIQYGGGSRALMQTSASVSVTISPKKLTVEYTVTEKVYNGAAQEVGYSVTGEVAGYPANCRVEYDSAPTDAGTYNVNVFTNEPNYSMEENHGTFTITKAPLTVRGEDIVILAGYDYTIRLTYEGFCGYDNEDSLSFRPYVQASDLKLAFIGPGLYTVTPIVPENEKNYDITVVSCTVQVNRSVLSDDSVIGFTGKATGSFSSDAAISIVPAAAETAKDVLAFWKIPSVVYDLNFTGSSNKETYTVVMENVELPGGIKNICFINAEGQEETIDSYKYDKSKKTLTLVLTQTSGRIVVYRNLLWYVVPGAVLLIIVISLLIFHHRDRKKHKLNRLISGSAKVEADRYRKKIGEYEEKERRKI